MEELVLDKNFVSFDAMFLSYLFGQFLFLNYLLLFMNYLLMILI